MEHISLVDGSDMARKRMVEVLNNGGIVIYPTDTVYGVGGRADIVGMDGRISELKRRAQGKSFPYLVADRKMAEEYGIFLESARVLVSSVWPGATTLVVQHRDAVGTVGLRVPKDIWLRGVIGELKKPIIGTSANISGEPPATTVTRAVEMLPDAELAIDGGERDGAPSEVVDCTVNPPKTLRTR